MSLGRRVIPLTLRQCLRGEVIAAMGKVGSLVAAVTDQDGQADPENAEKGRRKLVKGFKPGRGRKKQIPREDGQGNARNNMMVEDDRIIYARQDQQISDNSS